MEEYLEMVKMNKDEYCTENDDEIDYLYCVGFKTKSELKTLIADYIDKYNIKDYLVFRVKNRKVTQNCIDIIEKFSGINSINETVPAALNWIKYLNELKDFFIVHSIEEKERLVYMKRTLNQEAKDFFECLEPNDFEKVVKIFEKRYLNPDVCITTIMHQLQTEKITPFETVSSFGIRLLRLAKLLDSFDKDASKSTVIFYIFSTTFLDGFDDQIKAIPDVNDALQKRSYSELIHETVRALHLDPSLERSRIIAHPSNNTPFGMRR